MTSVYPDPNRIIANEYGTTSFLKNVIKAPNIEVGDFTYYDDADDPTKFEERNVLFNYPIFGDKLIIGRYCMIAQGVQFIMGAANHRMSSISTYPFNVMGGVWRERTKPHLDELPRHGDIEIGNDVWIGREAKIMPGVKIGDGAIIGAYSVVAKNVPAYTIAVGNPVQLKRKRFDDEMIELLEELAWWNLKAEERAPNSPKQSGYSVKSPEKSGQNFTPEVGVYNYIHPLGDAKNGPDEGVFDQNPPRHNY